MQYKYMELVKNNLQNRGTYLSSKEVINIPFKDRINEYWRSMFLYKEEKPSDKSSLLGNFYIECDEIDFEYNKNTMIEVCEYLYNTYEIPYFYMDLFKTNRSIWLCIPFKVFNCYGSIKLNEIYKEMAVDINKHLKNKKLSSIDLSIYKWNGLIHALGSYLPKVKKWVSKFNYWDLIDLVKEEDLDNVKWDYGFTFEDIKVIEKAKKWFISKKNIVLNKKRVINLNNNSFQCMKRLKNIGLEEGYRNTSIFSYALYLKQTNVDKKNAIKIIQQEFNNPYVYTKECINTINSAYKSNKHFSCKYIKSTLSFLCDENNNCKKKYSTIIVPRIFIEKLNSSKVHYRCYHLLIDILKDNQIYKKDTVFNIQKLKHKKDFLNKLNILSELNIIKLNFDSKKQNVKCSLISQDKSIYKNHIILKISFINSNKFKNLKNEIKLLLELLRGSFSFNEKRLVCNTKISTLSKNLKLNEKTIKKHTALLSKLKIIFGKFITITTTIFKDVVRFITKKLREKICNKILPIENIYLEENRVIKVIEEVKRIFSLYKYKEFIKKVCIT